MAERNENKEMIERVVRVNRVAKVVKGGRRFSFSALVVVGDGMGRVGIGLGKANEVTEAIRKGVASASRSMKQVMVEGTTIPHEVIGHFGAGKVYMMPAEKGHGIIAAGPVRAVMEATGIEDISVKSLGSRNPHNMVRSTLEGLYRLRSFETVARQRGKDVEYLKSY